MSISAPFSTTTWYAPANRNRALFFSCSLALCIAMVDFFVKGQFGFGNLYFLPILLVAGFLVPWQIILMCVVFMCMREALNSATDKHLSAIGARMFLSLSGYAGTGLFVREVVANRQAALENLARIQEQTLLRRDMEEQVRVLVDSSPAAILITDGAGNVLDSNEAADRLLGHESGGLRNNSIRDYFPVLAAVPGAEASKQGFRTKIETRGRRRSGEVFPAHVWLSTYHTSAGPRLAAIVLDASEDLREREEEGLHRLLAHSHIVAGAVWHEVRNLCAAISVVNANMRRDESLMGNADFQALGNLVEGLKNLAAAELRPSADTMFEEVDVREVLEDLRIVIGGQLAEAEVDLRVELPESLPLVVAERYGLLQVFLNLAQNSLRAMRDSPRRIITVTAAEGHDRMVIRFCDTGRGVTDPQHLFQPFQRGAEVTGLGLYISRAMVRDFLGELTHEPQAQGCCFAISLTPANVAAEVHT